MNEKLFETIYSWMLEHDADFISTGTKADERLDQLIGQMAELSPEKAELAAESIAEMLADARRESYVTGVKHGARLMLKLFD